MPKNSTSKKKCPVCKKAFNDKDVVIKYHLWSANDADADKALVGHLQCVLHMATGEKLTQRPPSRA
jgi:hypothetical protein